MGEWNIITAPPVNVDIFRYSSWLTKLKIHDRDVATLKNNMALAA